MSKLSVHKVTLSTKKEVLLRELKISHQELAMQNAAQKAGDSPLLFAGSAQKEMLKVLLHSVDGKELTAAQREDLDSLFNFPEYMQLMDVMGKLMGTDEKSKPKIEFAKGGE